MEKIIRTLAELEAEVARFVGGLAPSPRGATLVTLSGELGVGKTAFTKAVAKALGVEEIVTSPTFVLEKIYLLPSFDGHAVLFKRLVHIDAYRLEKGADLAPLGFNELMRDSGNLILLEWPEKVRDALPEPDVKISFTVNTDGSPSTKLDLVLGSRTISYG
jgi:tRNA threonylcarbamoyladenosine biosynthesis protein TsaE